MRHLRLLEPIDVRVRVALVGPDELDCGRRNSFDELDSCDERSGEQRHGHDARRDSDGGFGSCLVVVRGGDDVNVVDVRELTPLVSGGTFDQVGDELTFPNQASRYAC